MVTEPERSRIEEAAVEILKTGDLETLTEFSIRVKLAERLNIDLSDLESKLLVRRITESYLLSLPDEAQQVVEVVKEQPNCNNLADNTDTHVCKLSNRRNVSVKKFRGETLVSFSNFYEKDGNEIADNPFSTFAILAISQLNNSLNSILDWLIPRLPRVAVNFHAEGTC
ncbi:hypothetical protein POM88_030211 [Heracleum sosnowskyi]|uniref:DEK-C domain-containing protein n=1 Tax=Heracleum sosnowskyi TaxID=360622 RepID=A0AAD8HW16_9APIA|nr:hypothetical protein POM88_030211 [Heracleum sosnowskyi]